MSEKTFKFVHILYVLLITNIISILYLAIGGFALTLVPVVYANIKITLMLLRKEIDGYSGILEIFNSTIKSTIKNHKKETIFTGVYSLILLISVYIIKTGGTQITASLNYLFIYVYFMIIIYWCYYAMSEIINSKILSFIDGLALMFINPKMLFSSIFTLFIMIILGLIRKEFLAVIAISLFSAIFVKINKPIIEAVKINN